MRILWLSNAPWVPTGYGVQTKLFAPRLTQAGHPVAVLALHGLEGGGLIWNGIQCYPRSLHPLSTDVLAAHAEDWQADVCVSLVDAWPIEPQHFARSDVRWVPWFPVDTDPISPLLVQRLGSAFCPIVFSRFGASACKQAGVSARYVPHGVETKVFAPCPPDRARQQLGLPADRFIAGMVAANKDWPSRKAFPQAMEAFARFCSRRTDSLLYLHTTRGDEPWAQRGGVGIHDLIRFWRLEKHVVFSNSYNVLMGLPEHRMASLYSAFDCLVSSSLGEGFGVPILEAQSCGCPVIVGEWTSMPELCFAGFKIPLARSEPFWTPLATYQRVPHIDAIVDGLEAMYQARRDPSIRHTAREGALAYDADLVTSRHWIPALQHIAAQIEAGSVGPGFFPPSPESEET